MESALLKSDFHIRAEIAPVFDTGHTPASYLNELEMHRKEEARLKLALAEAQALLREYVILAGDTSVSRSVQPDPARSGPASDVTARLTARQREIMVLVVAGHPSKNIAADLGISQRTVENHRAAIMKKTGSKSLPALGRAGLVALHLSAVNGFAAR
jgi:DNA-binding NarL/FixJ family response regulator